MTFPDKDRVARDRNNLALEDLAAANMASNETMLRLVEEVRADTVARDKKIDLLERNHRQMRWLVVAVCCAVVVMLGLGITNAVNLAQASDQQNQIKEINHTLLDCVNSTGSCGQVNAQNQAKILEEVKKYELIGFYCIRNNTAATDPKGENFLKCMNKLYPGGPQLEGRWP